jgi:hypothetical protein
MSGKGDTPRPSSVSRAELDERWARTFGKQEEQQGPTASLSGDDTGECNPPHPTPSKPH